MGPLSLHADVLDASGRLREAGFFGFRRVVLQSRLASEPPRTRVQVNHALLVAPVDRHDEVLEDGPREQVHQQHLERR